MPSFAPAAHAVTSHEALLAEAGGAAPPKVASHVKWMADGSCIEESKRTFSFNGSDHENLHVGDQLGLTSVGNGHLNIEADLAMRKEKFLAEAARYRQQIQKMERFIISPNAKFMQRWDVVVILSLLFTATVTPFEIGFLEPSLNALFFVNRCIDSIFFVDICLNFFVSYRNSAEQGGQWVSDKRKIVLRYLHGWFLIDLLTSLPIDVLLYALDQADVLSSTGADSTPVARLLRLLRVLKLVRIARASRIFKRWEATISLSYQLLSLIRFLCIAICTSHWLACLWGFVGVVSGAVGEDGELVEVEVIDGRAVWSTPHGYSTYSWVQKAGLQQASPAELYGVSFYVALAALFGSPTEISCANYVEFYVLSIMMLCGSAIWAYILGSGCGIIATLSPHLTEHRQTMDELNYFCRDKGLPRDLTMRLRTYFGHTTHLLRAKRYDSLLDKMTARLRGDASLELARSALAKVSYFEPLVEQEPEFLANVALGLCVSMYCPRENIPSINLTIIERGIGAKNGRILMAGSCFGEDMILSHLTFRDLEPAVSLAYTQVLVLHKGDLEKLLVEYPGARQVVRKAVVRMGLVRALLRVSEKVKETGPATCGFEALRQLRTAKLAKGGGVTAKRTRTVEDRIRLLDRKFDTLLAQNERVLAQNERVLAQMKAQMTAQSSPERSRLAACSSPDGAADGSTGRRLEAALKDMPPPAGAARRRRTATRDRLAAGADSLAPSHATSNGACNGAAPGHDALAA